MRKGRKERGTAKGNSEESEGKEEGWIDLGERRE